ncbi:MAG: DUF2911 domain-containing protein [Alphaproteobacteria bacterium]|nr:DUF2911 domain-containing protein [Alphaproteobacteria bacterium]
MNKNLLLVIFCFVAFELCAQIQTPQGSPNATVSTVVGINDVVVKYARPKAKGRKIFGEGSDFLVPYGKLWRTAANSGSVITFAEEVKFGGVSVPKGSYLILSTPNKTEWTVILYKDVAMGGNLSKFNQAEVAASVTVKSEQISENIQDFTINISDMNEKGDKANLQIEWEHTSVKIPIEVNFDAQVMKSIDANTKVNPNNLFQAAVYYLENGKDLNKALIWVNEALAANPSAFWMITVKARILKGLGKKDEALQTSKQAWEEAKKANNVDYMKMNEDLQKSL